MDDIYEVSRDEYVGFIGQINKNMMDVEQYYEEDSTIVKIKSKTTGIYLCSRIIPKDDIERYYVFNMPLDEERVPPKPVCKIQLDGKEEVQTFFNALASLQRGEKI